MTSHPLHAGLQRLILCGVVAGIGLGPSRAQSTGIPVSVQIGYDHLALAEERDDWRAWIAGVSIDPDWGAASIEYRRSERFGMTDHVGIADLWLEFRPGTFANARVWVAPDAAVHPTDDVLLEVFQSIAHVWEPSLQVRRMRYPGTDVWFMGLASGRYAGRWYLRAQALVADDGKRSNPSLSVSGRYYVREADRWVEARFVAGREIITTGAGGVLQAAASRVIMMTAAWALGERWSLRPTVSWQDDRALGSRIQASVRISLGL